MRSVPYEKPAPVGTGAGLTEANHRAPSSPEDRRPAISELPFALHYAAERAVEFAEIVFDMDREFEDELDWAGRAQARCYAPYAALYRCLPPSLPEPVRREAERMLAHG
ncbi:hypothetical protein BSL82_06040 [Tardibacter chloracetimidivorans]|uniref:Uncharacterized protein n=1 Tax=Tardibacter chloracetimidivorans TaxID=1921510 RepID=A0A1L3ZTI0_9SPHN|nr:hypothetical protein [Tardibacter chloracetimidivorans]API58928.1 hypothetical protein BSL82_06040 [Tardibacter chloracetimidivorans]